MPSISEIKEIVSSAIATHPETAFLITGVPGSGKSDSTVQIGQEMGLPDDRILVVHTNNHDIVDFTGVPEVIDGSTRFAPTEMFYRFREGTGPGLIVLEELPQSDRDHQTWAAGFILERRTPTFKLDPQVVILATGNRVEDKAGAKELLRHLDDRFFTLECETSLDDWCDWAIPRGINPKGIAFLRMRPDLLNDFDPNRSKNPTQRSWTAVFQQIPESLPRHLYLAACAGRVGEAAASEWTAAKDLMDKMPSIDTIRLNPKNAEVPTEPAVLYAVTTAMATTSTGQTFTRDMEYISRLSKEFQMVYVTDALRINPNLQATGDFIQWAIANKDIFMGGD